MEHYPQLRELVKTRKVDNIILALELSVGLNLTKQVVHDIQCLQNIYGLSDWIGDKWIISDYCKWEFKYKHDILYKDLRDNMDILQVEIINKGYVLS